MTDANEVFDESDANAWALLAETLPEAEVPPAARSRFHELLKGRERFAPFAAEIAQRFNAPIEAVRVALSRVDDKSAWLSMPVPGLQVLPVHANARGGVVISKLRAGTRIPRHRHRTREVTFVLDGELITSDAKHGRASCMDMPEGSEHALEVGASDDCLVVFASPPPT